MAAAHGRWLWRSLGAFALRIVAQPLAFFTGWRGLPPFEAWQSGALPYPWLLASQVVLAAWMARTASRVTAGIETPSVGRGRWLGLAAAVYGLVMGTRLVLGLTAFRDHWWFDAPLPTVFHLVLTTYLAVYAHYHLGGRTAAPTSS